MPFGWFKKREPEKKTNEEQKEPANKDQVSNNGQETADAINNKIDKRISKAKQELKQTVSLLLLGAGGCGKSTLFKQMQNIYEGETPKKALEVTTMAVRKQVFDDMIDLCRANKDLGAVDKECRIEDEKCCQIRDEIALLLGKATDEMEFTPKITQNIKQLWELKEIRQTWKILAKAHIMESTPYFLDKIIEIADPAYFASYADHVRVRHRTVGVLHATFNTTYQTLKWSIKVTDVGGQRSERRKWIHLFADVDAVLYVMSLNGYDKVLYEDNTRNCWDESFHLFSHISTLKEFRKTNFIVFLNKKDIFDEAIKDVKFSVYYKDCPPEHANDSEFALNYVKEEITSRFAESNKKIIEIKSTQNKDDIIASEESRSLYFHVTCATDKSQIEKILSVLQFEATKSRLQGAGLI